MEFAFLLLYDISTIIGYLMPNHLSTNILNILDLVWFGSVLWNIKHFRLFNVRPYLYMNIKNIRFINIFCG